MQEIEARESMFEWVKIGFCKLTSPFLLLQLNQNQNQLQNQPPQNRNNVQQQEQNMTAFVDTTQCALVLQYMGLVRSNLAKTPVT